MEGKSNSELILKEIEWSAICYAEKLWGTMFCEAEERYSKLQQQQFFVLRASLQIYFSLIAGLAKSDVSWAKKAALTEIDHVMRTLDDLKKDALDG